MNGNKSEDKLDMDAYKYLIDDFSEKLVALTKNTDMVNAELVFLIYISIVICLFNDYVEPYKMNFIVYLYREL